MKPQFPSSERLNSITTALHEQHPDILEMLEVFLTRRPELEVVLPQIFEAYQTLVVCFQQQQTLFTCGNGGSYSDSLHIAGELMKSFERKRPVPEIEQKQLNELPFGADLAAALEVGFRAIPLGMNNALSSALENDLPLRYLMFAQELYCLGKKGDVLLGISTSGNAKNVSLALTVAQLKGIKTIALTGQAGGKMGEMADIAIKVPASRTFLVQEFHIAIYHLLCAMVEATWFKIKK